MLAIHNDRLMDFIRGEYTGEHLSCMEQFLTAAGTFSLEPLPSGLFSAATITEANQYTGYQAVWVRDNVNVAHALSVTGQTQTAVGIAKALMAHFQSQVPKMEAIVAKPALARDPMRRPHVRFDGTHMVELAEDWSHAQNDALGGFVWLYSRFIKQGWIVPHAEDWDCLDVFLRYFGAIRYWEDEDSGAWEEVRKISASSIGAVLAGLRELAVAMHGLENPLSLSKVEGLRAEGAQVLRLILPSECVQPDPRKHRRYDSALLSLIHPFDIVEPDMADTIVREVLTNLAGDFGVRRYRGDSFWSPNYKQRVPENKRTTDSSNDLSARDALAVEDLEAQWCLFDPILSTIFGHRYLSNGNPDDRRRQLVHLNRSLGQLTGPDSGFPELRCPELYYLEGGRWMPSDSTPLLWTQVRLQEALWTLLSQQDAHYAG